MTDVAIPELDLTTATLDELGALAQREATAALSDLASVVRHYLRMGEIIQAARDARPREFDWEAWCESLGISARTAQTAMRMAKYRRAIPADCATVDAAIAYLKGLPDTNTRGKPVPYDPAVRVEAERLIAAGVPVKTASRMLGLSDSTVRHWLYPDRYKETKRAYEERARAARRETKLAAKALAAQREREERDRLARTTGGELAELYALVRKAALLADKLGMGEVVADIHRAEERVVGALKAERQN